MVVVVGGGGPKASPTRGDSGQRTGENSLNPSTLRRVRNGSFMVDLRFEGPKYRIPEFDHACNLLKYKIEARLNVAQHSKYRSPDLLAALVSLIVSFSY